MLICHLNNLLTSLGIRGAKELKLKGTLFLVCLSVQLPPDKMLWASNIAWLIFPKIPCVTFAIVPDFTRSESGHVESQIQKKTLRNQRSSVSKLHVIMWLSLSHQPKTKNILCSSFVTPTLEFFKHIRRWLRVQSMQRNRWDISLVGWVGGFTASPRHLWADMAPFSRKRLDFAKRQTPHVLFGHSLVVWGSWNYLFWTD